MKNQHLKKILEINLAVIFISTSGVLGRSILLPPEITIWWRCLFAVFIIGLYCWYKKYDFSIKSRKDGFSLLLSGLLFGGHWITYFYALQLSNVAIGMLSLFTYPVITALLEPLFFKVKLGKNQLILSGLVLLGIYFLTPEINFDNNYTKGVIMGVISAVFYALRNIITKRNLAHYKASKTMFYQMIIITIFLWPVLINVEIPNLTEWRNIVILALLTTAIGHTLFVNSFRHFRISTISIISSMSPIYGILFGMLFLHEIPALTTIFGGALILATVVIESFQSSKNI